jgi:2-succinyl-5-enolpyruvyl-6-hydroxy-3-cyclohexene-1-carboxylate synthase
VTVQAELVATLVDEWVRAGVRHAVIAPGSRSAPLALALLDEPGLEVVVRLDERSAAFTCLGIGLATGVPAVLCTTSGTAAAEAHAAIVEADLAGVPMIVATADRPVELQRVGAPQTVDQRDLFGRAVRAFVDLGAATSEDPAARQAWRSLASRIVIDATAGPAGPGPVHVNLPLREPLLATAGPLPPGRLGGAPWHGAVPGPGASSEAVHALLRIVSGVERGLVVAGAGASGRGLLSSPVPTPVDADAALDGDGASEPEDEPDGGLRSTAGAVAPSALRGRGPLSLARRLGWPVLADPRAWPRVPDDQVVSHTDAVLRSELARRALAPEVVIHLGAPHASKVLAGWWGESDLAATRHVLVDPYGRFADPERRADLVIAADPDELCAGLNRRLAGVRSAPSGYAATWRRADDAAGAAIGRVLEGIRSCSEPAIARELFAALPEDSTLVLASSMPVRDLEWFAGPRHAAPRVLANRGANGIDGVVSTALGVALARPRATSAAAGATAALVGDLAFFHDLTALVHGTRERVPDLSLVVIDNGGGGIFSFLPYVGELDEVRFERAFGTPQSADPAALARSLGYEVREVATAAELGPAIAWSATRPGISVVVVRTDRAANVAVHAALVEASIEAVEATGLTTGT